MALGASRWRVVRQLLMEAVCWESAAVRLGLGFGGAGVRAFDLAVADVGKPYWIKFTMDFTVFAYVAGICVMTGSVFGVVPALHATRRDVNEKLKEGGRNSSGSVRTRYLASAFRRSGNGSGDGADGRRRTAGSQPAEVLQHADGHDQPVECSDDAVEPAEGEVSAMPRRASFLRKADAATGIGSRR